MDRELLRRASAVVMELDGQFQGLWGLAQFVMNGGRPKIAKLTAAAFTTMGSVVDECASILRPRPASDATRYRPTSAEETAAPNRALMGERFGAIGLCLAGNSKFQSVQEPWKKALYVYVMTMAADIPGTDAKSVSVKKHYYKFEASYQTNALWACLHKLILNDSVTFPSLQSFLMECCDDTKHEHAICEWTAADLPSEWLPRVIPAAVVGATQV